MLPISMLALPMARLSMPSTIATGMAVKAVLTDDSVFHRATGEEVFIGPDAIVGRFSETIGAPDQWNVKFARLDSTSQLVGKDGRVVERGDFAVTAGCG